MGPIRLTWMTRSTSKDDRVGRKLVSTIAAGRLQELDALI